MTPSSAVTILPPDVARFGPLSPGLRRRIDSRGRVRYGFDLRSTWLPGGRDRRWLPVGTSREEAERRLAELRAMIDRARRGLPVVAEAVGLDSFATVAAEYLDELRAGGATPGTVELTGIIVRTIGRFLGSLPVAAITPEHLKAMRNALARPPYGTGHQAPATVNKHLNTVRAILNYAMNSKRIIRWNPANEEAVPRLPVEENETRKVRIFRPAEDAAFLRALPLKYAAAWAMSLYCGHRLRRTAVCRMRLDDVDLLARTITVRGFNVKQATRKIRSKRPRRTVILPIPTRALYWLTEQVKAARAVGSEWLFPSDQDPAHALTPHAMSKEFRKYATRAGYPDVRFHHALHNFTTRAKKRGLDDVEGRAMREAQAARGHDSGAATRAYDHTNEDPEALRRWYDAMDRWLDEEERIAQDSPKAPPRIDSGPTPH